MTQKEDEIRMILHLFRKGKETGFSNIKGYLRGTQIFSFKLRYYTPILHCI
jgi:hypothetical protein